MHGVTVGYVVLLVQGQRLGLSPQVGQGSGVPPEASVHVRRNQKHMAWLPCALAYGYCTRGLAIKEPVLATVR